MNQKKKKIYIIGHKNTDTDSVCSAIALAELKNYLVRNKIEVQKISASYSEYPIEDVEYEAVRTGKLSAQTKYVLDAYGYDSPKLMKDARTQVKDVYDISIDGVSGNISLRQAWKIMRSVKKATLAITDDAGSLKGLITTGDIAKSYMSVFDNNILARACTSFANIIDTLKGELLVGDPLGKVTKGKVAITSSNTEIIRQYIDEGDVAILGNRYEAQLCAIEQHASVIIVCDGANVSRTIRKIAADNGCAVISTAYDTYAVARLINQSLPVSFFMKTEGLVAFRGDDYIDDIREIMTIKRYRDFPIVGENNVFEGMISRRNLISMGRKQIILVDHNSASNSIDGINEAEVLEIIDHHSLSTIETIRPVVMRNEPVGSTATIIYQMYVENNIVPEKEIAGLLCMAILSSTKGLNPAFTTVVDELAVKNLAVLSDIDIGEQAMKLGELAREEREGLEDE